MSCRSSPNQTPSAFEISASVAFSALLTWTAAPKKATALGRCFRGAYNLAKPCLESGSVGGRLGVQQSRNLAKFFNGFRLHIRPALPPAKSALRPSRAALRPSLVEKSATTALMSALALGSAATFVSAAPPERSS